MTPSTVDLRRIAAAALAAARTAAQYLRAEFSHTPIIAQRKQLTDFTTTADLEAERIILAALRDHAPQWPILSEERPQPLPSASNEYWLVDPLCGTLNFYHRIPLFCVNIAFVQNTQPVAAVVADVMQEQFLVAVRGQGTNLIGRLGQTRRVSARTNSSLVAIDLGERSVTGAELLPGVQATTTQLDFRIFGSSIIYAYLAQGGIGGVIHEQAAPWDYAAGSLICAEAGAVISDGAGQPWRIGSPTTIAASSPEVHRYLLEFYQHSSIFARHAPASDSYSRSSDVGIHVADNAQES